LVDLNGTPIVRAEKKLLRKTKKMYKKLTRSLYLYINIIVLFIIFLKLLHHEST